jgi:hypothetical protein
MMQNLSKRMLGSTTAWAIALAGAAVSAAACGGGSSGSGVIHDTRGFQVVVPAGAPGQSVVHTFEPEVDLPYDPGDYDLDLLGITITSSSPIDFATLIEVEMKEFSLFGNTGGFDTVGRFEGVLPAGARSVTLGLRRTSLDSYVETFGDNLHLKVRVAGTAPAQPVLLTGSIGLRIEFEDGDEE